MLPDPRKWSVEDWDKVGHVILGAFALYVVLSSVVGWLILSFAAMIALLRHAEKS